MIDALLDLEGQKYTAMITQSLDPEDLETSNLEFGFLLNTLRKGLKILLLRVLKPRQSFCRSHKVSAFKS